MHQSQHLQEDEKPFILQCLSIGTDFDGYIGPLNKYPTALHFEVLEKDLREIVEELSNERGGELYITKTPEEITADNGKNNALRFLEKNCF